MAVSVVWLFLAVPWVGLQCVIVVFPEHVHLLSQHVPEIDLLKSMVVIGQRRLLSKTLKKI